MVGDIDGYWQILTDIAGATSVMDLPPHLAHLEWLVLSWCVFALLEGVCRSFQTSFLWKRWSPFVVSSRACLWKVQSLLPQNQLPCWGEPGLLFKSVHLLRASSAQAALLAMVHAKTGSLYTCALYGVLACIAWACDLLIVVYCEMLCAQIGLHALWGLVTLHRLSCNFLVQCDVVSSRMTAIFNPFSEAFAPAADRWNVLPGVLWVYWPLWSVGLVHQESFQTTGAAVAKHKT